MATIKAPVATFNGAVGGVQFANGEATTDNQAVIAYCEAAGYEVEVVDTELADGAEGKVDDKTLSDKPADDLPAGNASTDEWLAYALAHGTTPDELAGLGRDQIRDLITNAKTGE